MSITTLNTAMMTGNLAADVEVKEVQVGEGTSKVAEAAIYVQRRRNREASFRVDLSIWEGSSAYRALDYLTKGSLICVYGSIEPSPYITSSTHEPRAGLQINPVDRIELISVKGHDDPATEPESDG